MPAVHPIVALFVLLAQEVPDMLEEPRYAVIHTGDRWTVQKPHVGQRPPVAISSHPDRSAAERRSATLPRLRLNRAFVRFDPSSRSRTLVTDWTGQEDARGIEEDIREIFMRFAPAAAESLEETPVFMARLMGAAGHTAEEQRDPSHFVIYVDPFHATGRLHAAATILHELIHVDRYHLRGFHANRAAAVLRKDDFVLLGLADEFRSCAAEANLVGAFLNAGNDDASNDQSIRNSARAAMRNPRLNWPLAVTVLLGIEGPSGSDLRLAEARRQIVLDLAQKAGSYWDARHKDALDPVLRKTIARWYQTSPEWKQIRAERDVWLKAGALLSRVPQVASSSP